MLLAIAKPASSFKPQVYTDTRFFCCLTYETTFGAFDLSHLGQAGLYNLIVDLNGHGLWPTDFRIKAMGTGTEVTFPMYMTHDGGSYSKMFQGGVTIEGVTFMVRYTCNTLFPSGGYTVAVECRGV